MSAVLDDLAYRIADLSARVFLHRDFYDRVCRRCGEKRYNHVHGKIRGCGSSQEADQ